MRALVRPYLALGLVGVILGGCGDGGRALLFIPLQLEPSPAAFTLTDGSVEIALEEARITLGDMRVEAPVAIAERPLASSSLPHPGHSGSGEVGGEILGPFDLDLLGEAQVLGDVEIYTGTYGTASLGVDGSPAFVLRGVARVEDVERPFYFESAMDNRVEGIPFEHVLEEGLGDGPMQLQVDVAHLLSFGEWDTPDSDGDGVLTLSDGTFDNTIPFGVLSTPSWFLNFSDNP